MHNECATFPPQQRCDECRQAGANDCALESLLRALQNNTPLSTDQRSAIWLLLNSERGSRKEPHNGNDTEPRDPESFAYLDGRGDDEGQGLDSYWKWGFAAGWNDHKKHAVKEREEVERLRALVNTPTLHSFSDGVVLEAAHQRERWGADHDAGKEPADWFWLVGYLAGKALQAQTSGNTEKALHHTISTAAALANWHAAISGEHTTMRPGIDPVARGVAA
jgi:hypothetical protein